MTASAGEFARKIIESIDELFIDHVGPIAPILAEEAFSTWQAEIGGNLHYSSIKSISKYIDQLAAHIDNDSDRQAFLNDVYSIEALKVLQ